MDTFTQDRVADVCVIIVFLGSLFHLSQTTEKAPWWKRYGLVVVGCASLGIIHSHITMQPNARTWFHLMLYGTTFFFGGEMVQSAYHSIRDVFCVRILGHKSNRTLIERRPNDKGI